MALFHSQTRRHMIIGTFEVFRAYMYVWSRSNKFTKLTFKKVGIKVACLWRRYPDDIVNCIFKYYKISMMLSGFRNTVNIDILIGKDDTEPSVPSNSDYAQVYVGQVCHTIITSKL